ncbi:hypothetical protein [Roseateles violae]|uniref:Uncharacterized protein n=1 Tax=Roseateles violae TaxID=3058042 RepID=A0ABT8DXN2_9BURK|nr:hypothetical protein [Pelomonas sp. PFR6]MDN3922114.1 hypothetical protein [Pelomonas sp. PFR6]
MPMPSRFFRIAGVLMLLAAAALLFLLFEPPADEAAPPPRAEPPSAAPVATVSPFGAGATVPGPEAMPAQPPVAPSASQPSLSYAELKQLIDEQAQKPDPDGELGRMAAALIFSDALLRLRQLYAEGGDPAEMQALARLIDERLPQQLGQIDATEADRVKALLLELLEPDPQRRQAAWLGWRAARAGASRPQR